jgi:hypothetical protein
MDDRNSRKHSIQKNEDGHRHIISCKINAPSTTAFNMLHLPPRHVVALQDTVDMRFIHPYSQKSCTIKHTQVPVIPAFTMTAHKSQGQTREHAIVDLQSCHGTESPYVMLSHVTSLEGVTILRPFNKRKIQCRQSEDRRREEKRLDFLRLHTILLHGDESERKSAQEILSKIQYHDHISNDVEDIESPIVQVTSNSAKQLQHLQNSNYQLTSGPTMPNVLMNDDMMVDAHNSPSMLHKFRCLAIFFSKLNSFPFFIL